MSGDAAPSSQQGLKDVIVTLPGWGLGTIAALCLASLVFAVALTLLAQSDEIKANAVHLMVVLVPLGSAVIAGVAIRRTSTRQIDRLVTGFLEQTLFERLQVRCQHTPSTGRPAYPFDSVKLLEPSQGTSYVVYELGWRPRSDVTGLAPAQVGFKCNVFNFELFTSLQLNGVAAPTEARNLILRADNLGQHLGHPILMHFMSVLQGSINEGYEAQIGFRPHPEQPHACTMHMSLRQKLRENFLTSPFLKRYFAEDAAIATGVLYEEWLRWRHETAPAELTNP